MIGNLKFLCSYGGRILPRYPDGKLRYHGGETRLLSVHRSISFSELLVKLGEMCGTGSSLNLRCQLPSEDLDALVSITSDEDLVNLIEEYDRAAAAQPPSSLKIRAFLSAPKKTSSPPQSTASSASSSSNDTTSPKSPFLLSSPLPPRSPAATRQCVRQSSRPPLHPIVGEKSAGKLPHNYLYQYQYPNQSCHGHKIGSHVYVIHNGNHWQ